MQNYHRHGDITLTPIKELPTGSKKEKQTNEFILAYGEKTGHHHKLTGEFNIHIFDGVRFLEILRESSLTHQEHAKQKVKPGIYRVGDEQEFEYELGSIRKVVD